MNVSGQKSATGSIVTTSKTENYQKRLFPFQTKKSE